MRREKGRQLRRKQECSEKQNLPDSLVPLEKVCRGVATVAHIRQHYAKVPVVRIEWKVQRYLDGFEGSFPLRTGRETKLLLAEYQTSCPCASGSNSQ